MEKDTNEYLVDIKVYERALRSELPYLTKSSEKGLFKGSDEGLVFTPGYHSFTVYMTPKELDEFYEWASKKAWMKIIGTTPVAV